MRGAGPGQSQPGGSVGAGGGWEGANTRRGSEPSEMCPLSSSLGCFIAEVWLRLVWGLFFFFFYVKFWFILMVSKICKILLLLTVSFFFFSLLPIVSHLNQRIFIFLRTCHQYRTRCNCRVFPTGVSLNRFPITARPRRLISRREGELKRGNWINRFDRRTKFPLFSMLSGRDGLEKVHPTIGNPPVLLGFDFFSSLH